MDFNNKKILLNQTALKKNRREIKGSFTTLNNEVFYKIENHILMEPFFMTVVNDSNLWLFIANTGGLTAGRENMNHAVFAYEPVDKVMDNFYRTGPQTILLAENDKHIYLWEPFKPHSRQLYQITANLYKSYLGDKIIFEEINHDLALSIRYQWLLSDKFGFVKKTVLQSHSPSYNVRLLDGFKNILPPDIEKKQESNVSCLVDGYKKNELFGPDKLGLFTLTAQIIDKAEPRESFRAATAWHTGIACETILLSEQQITSFKNGLPLKEESLTKGKKGSYYIISEIELAASGRQEWYMAVDTDQTQTDVSRLARTISAPEINKELRNDIISGSNNLLKIIGNTDGLQCTADKNSVYHHFANVLFNDMRGGIFTAGYSIPVQDYKNFIKIYNKNIFNQHKTFFKKLPTTLLKNELLEKVDQVDDKNLERLSKEYLPVTFSRRHGDPSRPWNVFNIKVKDKKGNPYLYFEGNWRDIFQNWEALTLSYPGFIENIIIKFVNASTADGYNAYRITKSGIDWEKPDPEDPWANIGYWGDHQLIYLLKLLENAEKFYPGSISRELGNSIFVYADIPYEIKDIDSIIKDPHNTINFNFQKDKSKQKKYQEIGADGHLLYKGKDIYRVNLIEKLMCTLLAKICNYIPGGGIWMNTQRPEWNDANNALVGYGISMVTLYYLRRFLAFTVTLLEHTHNREYKLSKEITVLFQNVYQTFTKYDYLLNSPVTPADRFAMLYELGKNHSKYRQKIYKKGFSKHAKVSTGKLLAFLKLVIKHLDRTIKCNQRSDHLFHSYNILQINNNTAAVSTLYEMLEGQVAALSSGALTARESFKLLQSLRKSRLYRQDQHSYMLYPVKDLPAFMDKNIINPSLYANNNELTEILHNTDIIEKDAYGNLRFSPRMHNKAILKAEIDKFTSIDPGVKQKLLDIYETVFRHMEFTGRSGTMYAFEGIGSIYWHMVSKLLLAAQETYITARAYNPDSDLLTDLADIYYDIRKGIGFNKSPAVYGAFPTDPYSHTPADAGARQPGMTGQVKEEIITRLMELGVFVQNGCIVFNPTLLRKSEFLQQKEKFTYINARNEITVCELDPGTLAFTYCRVPVYYLLDKNNFRITVDFHLNEQQVLETNILDKDISRLIFSGNKKIKSLAVRIPERMLLA